MTKLFLVTVLAAIAVTGCNSQPEQIHEYKLSVTFTNGVKDTINVQAYHQPFLCRNTRMSIIVAPAKGFLGSDVLATNVSYFKILRRYCPDGRQ